MKRLLKKSGEVMKLVYALEEFPKNYSKAVFLAGPTPRDNNTPSWRLDAIKHLDELGYDGVVFIPEPRDGKFSRDYDKQVDWETEGLNRADCILFWVPRDLETLPGFTTNIEWGVWENSGKVVMGFPKNSPKNRYIEKQLNDLQLPVFYNLKETIQNAINMIGNGSYRENGECYVPLYIWNTKEFQNWYKSQKQVGNELRYAKVNYVFKMPKAKKVFLWILHVHVYIKAENRIKENEFVLSRTDICSLVLYKRNLNIEDSEIVLVKEFRSPANNSKAMIYEIPGGSSTSDKENIDVIHDEIHEEIGIDIDKSRFKFVISRQMVGTLSAHKCHLYELELNEDELNEIKKQQGIVHGVEEDTERTYTEVFKLKDILEGDLADWSNIGMILSVLH